MGAGEVVSNITFIDQIGEGPDILQSVTPSASSWSDSLGQPFSLHAVLKPALTAWLIRVFVPRRQVASALSRSG